MSVANVITHERLNISSPLDRPLTGVNNSTMKYSTMKPHQVRSGKIINATLVKSNIQQKLLF